MIHLDKDWSTYKKLLFLQMTGGGISEYEVTGNPVSFVTNIVKPLSGLTIPFLPFQEGTGDPSPENVRPISGRTGVNIGRTEKNLLGGIALANAVVSSMPSATISTENEYVSFAAGATVDHCIIGLMDDGAIYGFKFKENTRYTFVLSLYKNSGTGGNLRIVYTDGTTDDISVSSATVKETVVVVTDEGKTVKRLVKRNLSGTTRIYYEESGIFEGVLTEQDFEEWVGTVYPVTFPGLGKNLLPGMETGAINQSTGQDEADITAMRCVGYIPVEPGETYTLGTLASSGNIRFFGYDEDKNYLGNAVVRNVTNATYTVGSGTYFIRFKGATERFTGVDLQFEKSDLHTAYEPFDNTIYCGTFDAVTGVLTISHKVIDVSGLSWNRDGDTRRYRLRLSTYSNTPTMEIISNALVPTLKSIGSRPDYSIRMYANNYYQVEVAMPNTFDITSFKEFIKNVDGNGTHLQIMFKYNNPPVYQLAPLSIQTIIGDNTIWTDTNGENTIRYKKKG